MIDFGMPLTPPGWRTGRVRAATVLTLLSITVAASAVSVPVSPKINPLTSGLHSLAPATDTVGGVIQTQINAAAANGGGVVQVPPGTHLLSAPLIFPRGARNITLQGGPDTVLRRGYTAATPSIIVGGATPYGFMNESFAPLPQTSLLAVNAGDTTITASGGQPLEVGYYALIGTDQAESSVEHATEDLRFWTNRELVLVQSVNGNVATLSEPIGRSINVVEARRMKIWNYDRFDDLTTSNILIKDLVIDGRNPSNNTRNRETIYVSAAHNFGLNNVTVRGFDGSGVTLQLVRGAMIDGLSTDDGNTTSLGYGVDCFGCRFVTVRNSVFRNHRSGVVFAGGTMDGLVEDSIHETPVIGGFDAGHGQGELRITYRRCIADVFVTGNPSWPRLVENVRFEQCTARRSYEIFANTKNVLIEGKHPRQPISFQRLHLYAENYTNGWPSGYQNPQSVIIRNGRSERSDGNGTNIFLMSMSNAPWGVKSFEATNWEFVSTRVQEGSAVNLFRVDVPSSARFINCTFINRNWWSAPMVIGAGRWDVSIQRSKFDSAWNRAISVLNGSNGRVQIESSEFKRLPLTSSFIDNQSSISPAVR